MTPASATTRSAGTAAPAQEPRALGRRAVWLVAGATVLVYLVLASRFLSHFVDDAYISFRYARNLADGHGLVYNIGERVEGYTNFLWVLLLEAGMKLGQDPELVARLLGILAGAALVAVVTHFAARRLSSRASLWIAPAICAVHPAISVWAGGGLEGPLFALFLTWGVCLAVLSAESDRLHLASALLLGLAALTRPEGAGVAVVLGAGLFFLYPDSRRRLVAWAGVFLLLWAPHFAWRWWYYGSPLPNTFYAKVDMGGSEIRRGFVYLHSFARETGYWLLVPMAGLAFSRRRRAGLLLAALFAAYVGYVVFVGGDTLCMHRFFVPLIGLLGILVAWGVEGWRERLRERLRLRRLDASRAITPLAVTVLAVAALAVAVAYTIVPSFAGPSFDGVRVELGETATWKTIGLWFRQNAEPDASIAVLPAGAIPYFSGLRAIDMLGLNDAIISHAKVRMGKGEAGHEKYDLAYVLRRAPAYIVVGVYNLASRPEDARRMILPYYPLERDLLNSEEFRDAYAPRLAQTPQGCFIYFRRKE